MHKGRRGQEEKKNNNNKFQQPKWKFVVCFSSQSSGFLHHAGRTFVCFPWKQGGGVVRGARNIFSCASRCCSMEETTKKKLTFPRYKCFHASSKRRLFASFHFVFDTLAAKQNRPEKKKKGRRMAKRYPIEMFTWKMVVNISNDVRKKRPTQKKRGLNIMYRFEKKQKQNGGAGKRSKKELDKSAGNRNRVRTLRLSVFHDRPRTNRGGTFLLCCRWN